LAGLRASSQKLWARAAVVHIFSLLPDKIAVWKSAALLPGVYPGIKAPSPQEIFLQMT
jgi:hypothetical protein